MSSGNRRQSGFTYVIALLMVAATGVGLLAVTELWSHARQREKEAELIWVGNQYKQAIGLYYEGSPGATKRYPEKLQDLLEDHRFLTPQRYLRRLYLDPTTSKPFQTIQTSEGGLQGVRSTSTPPQHGDRTFVYEPPGRSTSADRTKAP